MCGIIGYIGSRNAIDVVISGLKRLEYRGYDSAGIAFFTEKGIEVRRCKGKIKDLEALIQRENLFSENTIGHTRWATHGKPSEENAHPHRSNSIVLVHNGIIENYLTLKNKLLDKGHKFTSETDTEVICHLISDYSLSLSLEEAVREAIKHLKGTYALAVIREEEPDKIVGVRKDSPLVVGLGDNEYFIASDIPAFLTYTNKVLFLEDDEMVIIKKDGVDVKKLDGSLINKEAVYISWSPSMAEKGGYKHFMLKEIYEQPRSIADTLRGRINLDTGEVNLEEFGLPFNIIKKIKKIFIVACGTSYHAGLVGKYIIEDLARIPVEVDIASEFRYRKPLINKDDLLIVITQSGETADTLAAQREAKKLGATVLSICNVLGSSSSREADAVFYTHSGPEIGVASTKAFTAQMVGLYLFAIGISKIRKKIDKKTSKKLLDDVLQLPSKVDMILQNDENIRNIAKEFFKAKGFLYLGRGINYPIALEGALKLKEISYIHAEGYAAGEMKHGPIALIDEELPVVVIVPNDNLKEKIISNIQEVKSRGGKIITITHNLNDDLSSIIDNFILVPESNKYLNAVINAVPIQLLAYHIAVLRGCDVDQPRNLAKSVTVE
jgi:glucosamine--fructose-6-phosphate aminotransferase (isomerizing)